MLSWSTVILEPYSYTDGCNIKIGHLFHDGDEFIYIGKNGDVITATTEEQMKALIRTTMVDEQVSHYRIATIYPEPKRKVIIYKHIASKRAMTYLATMCIISSVFAASLVSSLVMMNILGSVFSPLLLAISVVAYTGMVLGIGRWNDES